MSGDHSQNRVTIWVSDQLHERIDDSVDWRHDSRSQYVREAIQYRMRLEDELDRAGLALPADEATRERALRDIAIAAIDAAADDLLDETELDDLRPDGAE